MISKQTAAGAELIAYCAANNIAIPLTTIKYGVGAPASEADIENLTDLISIQGSVPITAKTQQTNTVFCEGQISNVTPVQITTGFLMTEAGVYGTDPRTSIETLIQYDWYNDGGLYFPPASVGEVTKNTSLGIVVGTATTVISQWNGSNVLATKSNLADAVTSIMGGTFIPQYAIQDAVTKIAGNVYRDNNDGYNYYCTTTTDSVVNSTSYFKPFTNKVLSDRLDSCAKVSSSMSQFTETEVLKGTANNLNSVTSVFEYYNGNYANIPTVYTGTSGIAITFSGSGRAVQLALSNTAANIAYRAYTGSTWTSWVLVK